MAWIFMRFIDLDLSPFYFWKKKKTTTTKKKKKKKKKKNPTLGTFHIFLFLIKIFID